MAKVMIGQRKARTLAQIFGSSEVAAHAKLATAEFVSKFSLTLAFGRKRGPDVRSGLYCSLSGRYFLATAAHKLEDADLSRVTVVPRPSKPWKETNNPLKEPWPQGPLPSAVPVKGIERDDGLADVLVLEIEALPGHGPWLQALDLTGAHGLRPRARQRVVVAGVVNELARERFNRDLGTLEYAVAPFCLHTYVTSQPTEHLEEFDKRTHFLIRYALEPNGAVHKDLSARGMSGAPVFLMPAVKGRWTPSNARLIGIQQAAYPGAKVLKVTHLRHLLRLVHKLVESG
jgi:hypothetical protein